MLKAAECAVAEKQVNIFFFRCFVNDPEHAQNKCLPLNVQTTELFYYLFIFIQSERPVEKQRHNCLVGLKVRLDKLVSLLFKKASGEGGKNKSIKNKT